MSKNITIHGIGKNIDAEISFYAREENVKNDYDVYERFIKRCEFQVRNDMRYKAYISKLKSSGLNFCSVLGELSDEDGVSIEMHHGPIFNLFDICDIVARALFKRGDKHITTFKVADLVLTEHEKDNIMVVMLSKSSHKGAHNSMFIHMNSTVGRIERFIENYIDGIEKEHKKYIRKYLEQCKEVGDTVDNGLFDTAKKLRSFK